MVIVPVKPSNNQMINRSYARYTQESPRGTTPYNHNHGSQITNHDHLASRTYINNHNLMDNSGLQTTHKSIQLMPQICTE